MLQCEAVTGMLERALAGLLTDASFEAVAEAAAERCDDLQTLPSACKRFGLLSDEVRRASSRSRSSRNACKRCAGLPSQRRRARALALSGGGAFSVLLTL